MQKFRKGDVVTTGTGGARMTVLACTGHTVLCSWTRDGMLVQETFEPAQLRKVVTQQQQQPPTPPEPEEGAT